MPKFKPETKTHTHKCAKCGNTWRSKLEKPKQCPMCKTYLWELRAKMELLKKKMDKLKWNRHE
jgi:rubrerythrin